MNIFNKMYDNNEMYYGLHVFYKFVEFTNGLIGKALDVGCGEGRYSIFLAKNNFEVIAFDKSINAINKLDAIAKNNNYSIQAIHSEAKSFRFEKQKYDLIVASTILDQLNENERVQTVRNIKNSLKCDGIVYVGVFNTDDPGYEAKYRDGKINYQSECASTINYYYGIGELKIQFGDFKILYYSETYELDTSHGSPHYHGISRLIAKKKGK